MRILGLVPSTTDIRCAVLEGTVQSAVILPSPNKHGIPKNPADADELHNWFRFICTWLNELNVDRVCVLQVGSSQKGKPSPIRIKVEALIQLASTEMNIKCSLIPPQTLRAREKRFFEKTGGTPESVLNGGVDFPSIAWRDAVLIAWVGLE